jgi:serine phosphatase RsbU (regulator of sigma subunit)
MDYYKEITFEQDLIAKISEQKDKIEFQQRELEESLRYAGSIQSALLPGKQAFTRFFSDCFILFKPRDIVSGDFYWIHKKGSMIAVAAADCTGHGVPGAFMSILGISFLNEIVGKCIPKASIILNKLRESIMKTLHQTGAKSEHKDGMDIALCVIDTDRLELEFSGAFNPLYLIRGDELIEVRGDKMPIGISFLTETSFTNHKLSILPGDQIYIFSDGFADQFGGPEEKKFRYGPFKDLLLSIHKQKMEKQQVLLEKKFDRWKRDIEQVDDVLIIGLKI